MERVTVYGDKRVEIRFRYQAEFKAVMRYIEAMSKNNTEERAVV